MREKAMSSQFDETEEKAQLKLEKEWGSPMFLAMLLLCHAFIFRKVFEQMFPGPSTLLVCFMVVVAVVNFVLKVAMFADVKSAPRVKHCGSWPKKLEGKKLSIIFPAYNEADTIGSIVKATLASSKSANIEVIVTDDRSKDNTWQVLQAVADELKDPRFKPIAGKERGKVAWKGKNWSVTQGFEAATGDYLLFCDADVLLRPSAPESFLSTMAESEQTVGWVSFVPKTRFSCLSEYLFNWPGTMIAQALIPKAVNSGKKTYAFGQCNLFERSVYERLGGHRGVGHIVAESHALAARAKELNLPMRCCLAYDHAELVWYFNFMECWKGQLKSIRGRMSQPMPLLNRPPPRPIVAILMSLFVAWQIFPWLLAVLQLAKVLEGGWVLNDYLLLLMCVLSVASSFLNRLLGFVYLGYDMHFWWMAPWVSSFMLMLLAIRACRPDGDGRWNDGTLPAGFSLPKDAAPVRPKHMG